MISGTCAPAAGDRACTSRPGLYVSIEEELWEKKKSGSHARSSASFFFFFYFYSLGSFLKSTPPHRHTSKTLELLVRIAAVWKMFTVAIVCFLSLPPTTGLAEYCSLLVVVHTHFSYVFHAGFWEPCRVNVVLVNLQDSLAFSLKKNQ